MTGAWQGAEYLFAGDGYRTVLESLEHYTGRLQSLRGGSEMGGAGSFGLIIQQAASKRLPQARRTALAVREFLLGDKTAESLAEGVPVMISALECYDADTRESGESGRGGADDANAKLRRIREAKIKINSFGDS